ncbi:pseudaminic acid cytidylyltransferase [Pelagibacteraceae bacterium]|nr:pseudaminic acid cytidylyltransferase [Pelagibacteraceae bacterium]
MKEKILAIIPARGGSKRIPKKNIKFFYGKPIISYAINTLKKTGLFHKIIVSTDDMEIAKIAKRFGAEVPFIRSFKISKDNTSVNAVVVDAINFFEGKDIFYKKICCFYPTSVFSSAKEIKLACNKLKKNTDYVFTATKYDHPIQRSFTIKNNKIKMLYPNKEKKMTQTLPIFFHDAGQFYFGWRNSWIHQESVFSKNSKFIEIPRLRSQDIDNLSNWKNAEKLWKVKL